MIFVSDMLCVDQLQNNVWNSYDYFYVSIALSFVVFCFCYCAMSDEAYLRVRAWYQPIKGDAIITVFIHVCCTRIVKVLFWILWHRTIYIILQLNYVTNNVTALINMNLFIRIAEHKTTLFAFFISPMGHIVGVERKNTLFIYVQEKPSYD